MSMPAGGAADEVLGSPGFCLSQFFLPLPECLFGAAAPPVTRDRRRPFRIHAALIADVGPQVVHDGLRLAVDEDVHLPGQPGGGGDRLDQRRVIACAVLGYQISAPTPIDPADLNGLRCGQYDLVLLARYLDERLAN